ncbi:hypothetical protein B0H14DRAFT_2807919, partial [Mycena olivaceomarginata]
ILSVSPDPPKMSADLTVTVDLDDVETIKEGTTVDILVNFGTIKLLRKTFDICGEACVSPLLPSAHVSPSRHANATTSCSVEPGAYQIVQTVELPK